MISPCKGCDRRTVTCHSLCREYQRWKALSDERRDIRYRENANPISDSSKRGIWQWIKGRK